jgi:hypothetical protein
VWQTDSLGQDSVECDVAGQECSLLGWARREEENQVNAVSDHDNHKVAKAILKEDLGQPFDSAHGVRKVVTRLDAMLLTPSRRPCF